MIRSRRTGANALAVKIRPPFGDRAKAAAAHAELTRSLGEFNAENVKALKRLRDDNRIKILRFSDELIKVFGKLSREVLADIAAKDPLTKKVYDSYLGFLAGIMDWQELSERGYMESRRLALA